LADLSRPLTGAEVALLRRALAGDEARTDHPTTVGYVCRGSVFSSAAFAGGPKGGGRGQTRVVAVTDHANLTWRSPLTGPNEDALGPRFPSMTGIYETKPVQERLEAAGGIIVWPGVVAGVGDDWSLNAYEAQIVRKCGHQAASSELVPVAIIAAHMGLRVAAAVVIAEGSREEETGSGRS
jgi:hypothetical protein